jgi:hypothetical protein
MIGALLFQDIATPHDMPLQVSSPLLQHAACSRSVRAGQRAEA